MDTCKQMRVVVTGHVDHGKSTLLGRLLYEFDPISRTKLNSNEAANFSHLLDALKEEREKGITINSAKTSFRSKKRYYQMFDAPGHTEFIRNMVSGTTRASAALLLVDASEGVQENTTTHSEILQWVGIDQVIVAVSKMDLVNYSKATFETIFGTLCDRFSEAGTVLFVPVSAQNGCNIVSSSSKLSWYQGPTLIQALDSLRPPQSYEDFPLRLPIQDRYGQTWVGQVASGKLAENDTIVFYPSLQKAKVKKLHQYPDEIAKARAGEAVAIELESIANLGSGQLVCKPTEVPPFREKTFSTNILCLEGEIQCNKQYLIKCGTAQTQATVESIESDTASGQLATNKIATCKINLKEPLAIDSKEFDPFTSRFVLIDNHRIVAAGHRS